MKTSRVPSRVLVGYLSLGLGPQGSQRGGDCGSPGVRPWWTKVIVGSNTCLDLKCILNPNRCA